MAKVYPLSESETFFLQNQQHIQLKVFQRIMSFMMVIC